MSLCKFDFAFPSISLSDLLPSIDVPTIEIPSFGIAIPPCALDLY